MRGSGRARLVGLGDAEVRAEVEEIVLNPRRAAPRGSPAGAWQSATPELGVELVDGAVAVDPQVVLGDARPEPSAVLPSSPVRV